MNVNEEKLSKDDPDYYRKLALLSQKKWKENGRTPRGFAVRPDVAREANAKALITIKARARKRKDQQSTSDD